MDILIQTEQGEFKEVVAADPKQTAGQINPDYPTRLSLSGFSPERFL